MRNSFSLFAPGNVKHPNESESTWGVSVTETDPKRKLRVFSAADIFTKFFIHLFFTKSHAERLETNESRSNP